MGEGHGGRGRATEGGHRKYAARGSESTSLAISLTLPRFKDGSIGKEWVPWKWVHDDHVLLGILQELRVDAIGIYDSTVLFLRNSSDCEEESQALFKPQKGISPFGSEWRTGHPSQE
jgi:hypothetical protein